MVGIERDNTGGFPTPAVFEQSHEAVYQGGRVELKGSVDWPDGIRLAVTPVIPAEAETPIDGHVIIVGFGLPGRCVADLLDRAKLSYTIIETNPVTVETQKALGRDIRQGSGTDAETLVGAGLNSASMLALTIPDEEGVLQAIALARRLRPDIYIVARTNYSSQGMKALQLGANEVIKAEQAVAVQLYERLSRRIGGRQQPPSPSRPAEESDAPLAVAKPQMVSP